MKKSKNQRSKSNVKRMCDGEIKNGTQFENEHFMKCGIVSLRQKEISLRPKKHVPNDIQNTLASY